MLVGTQSRHIGTQTRLVGTLSRHVGTQSRLVEETQSQLVGMQY